MINKLLFLIILLNTGFIACKRKTYKKINKQQQIVLKTHNWGYSYENLIDDVKIWQKSPFITIDTIGLSVQGRLLLELIITNKNIPSKEKKTIYIHARTHPNEVQSFWIANEMIKFLISKENFSRQIRAKYVFHIVPMYNPDGVELEYSRENANTFDLERNWYSDNIQPELKALKNRFLKLMESDSPILIALNLHSSSKCKRYFVFHHANGTSIEYEKMQKKFISLVRNNFEEGIMPWNFEIKWNEGIICSSPESWWWDYYGSDVLAITYEDKNCMDAGDYIKTAQAIIKGIDDFFNFRTKK